MKYPRPLCENSALIFNRKAVLNLTSFDYYVLRGKKVYMTPQLRESYKQNFPFKKFSRMAHEFEYYVADGADKKRVINWDGLENSYCGFDENKHKVYLFLAVPCGHCVLCTDKKHNDFIARVKMENQSSDTLPLMVTLTYAPPFLPFRKRFDLHFVEHDFESSEVKFFNNMLSSQMSFRPHKTTADVKVSTSPGYLITRNVPYVFDEYRNQYIVSDKSYYGFEPTLLKSDIQKFLKRLRIYWQRHRAPFITKPLRYVCFGEYGHNTHRPHYHLILWNVPYSITDAHKAETLNQVEEVKKDILRAWNMCVPQACQCEIARDAGAYVGKYISKNMIDSQGKKGFSLASNRGGGIGSPFIYEQLEFLREHPSIQKIQYTDKWNGHFVESTFGRFVHDKVFPSPAKMIPDKYKQALRYDGYLLSVLARVARHYGFPKIAEDAYQCHISNNKYLSFVPDSFSDFVTFPRCFLADKTATFIFDFVDYIEMCREDCWQSIEGIVMPDETEVFRLSNLRYQHDTLFDRPEVTDDYIFATRNSILEKRSRALDSEVF